MVKHTKTIRQQHSTNYLSVFDHFLGLALKRLTQLLFSHVFKGIERDHCYKMCLCQR